MKRNNVKLRQLESQKSKEKRRRLALKRNNGKLRQLVWLKSK